MLRDGQRGAVYAWEGTIAREFPDLKRKLDLAECTALVHRIWNDFHHSAPPRVTDGRSRRSAYGNRYRIALPRWSRQAYVVIHETCHALTEKEPPHGRHFARLLLELLAYYEKVPVGTMRSLGVHQKPRRVHFAKSEEVPKRKSREWRGWLAELHKLQEDLSKARVAVRVHNAKEPRS